MKSRLSLVALTATLAACGGSSTELSKISSGAACTFISGGGTSVSNSVPVVATDCSMSNLPQAADGNPETAADITAAGNAGGDCAIRVTAQQGIVFPEGNVAAVIAMVERSGAEAFNYVAARTLLQGQVQDEVQFSDGIAYATGVTGAGGAQIFKVQTSKPFDAVEFSVGQTTEMQTVKVYEFCSQYQ